jgi:uncharacterized protein YukE
MIITKATLSQAAADLRSAEAQLSQMTSELQERGVWTGADADRFQREWNDLVRARLHQAAGLLDATAVITLL